MQLRRMFRLFLFPACAAVAFTAHAADTNAYLYIAHAAAGRSISTTTNPEFPVDIALGGHCIAQGVSFGEIRGPFTLPAGPYSVRVSVADAVNPCGATPNFSSSVSLGAGTTSMGYIGVNNAHQLFGAIFAINLNATGTSGLGSSRAVVVNTTPDNLTATLTQGDSKVGDPNSMPLSASFPAGIVTTTSVIPGEYTLTVFPQGSTTAVTTPSEFDIGGRSVIVLLFSGSTADNTVQVIGPKAIRAVF